jgi:hypothetical protein
LLIPPTLINPPQLPATTPSPAAHLATNQESKIRILSSNLESKIHSINLESAPCPIKIPVVPHPHAISMVP